MLTCRMISGRPPLHFLPRTMTTTTTIPMGRRGIEWTVESSPLRARQYSRHRAQVLHDIGESSHVLQTLVGPKGRHV